MAATDRKGVGLVLGIVLWVLALAFLYAMVQSHARSGATATTWRTAQMRRMVFAAQSALEEASFAWRHHVKEPHRALREILGGSRSGVAHQPELTRATFGGPGEAPLTIGAVGYTVVSQGASPAGTAPLQVDLEVEVDAAGGRVRLGRSVRRRHLVYVNRIIQTAGPPATIGRVVHAEAHLDRAFLFEAVEP